MTLLGGRLPGLPAVPPGGAGPALRRVRLFLTWIKPNFLWMMYRAPGGRARQGGPVRAPWADRSSARRCLHLRARARPGGGGRGARLRRGTPDNGPSMRSTQGDPAGAATGRTSGSWRSRTSLPRWRSSGRTWRRAATAS
ncbi:MAG: DUF4291 family protein [Deltaproteobacteria bacterium]|nr:DUF4291 family protein [Deltaproteobacteria bacterium]